MPVDVKLSPKRNSMDQFIDGKNVEMFQQRNSNQCTAG